jgi:hypothetical protein
MKSLPAVAVFLCCLSGFLSAAEKTRELSVALSENREVNVAVPEGFKFEAGNEDSGPVMKLSDEKMSVTLDVQFLPDPERRFGNARARKEQMNELFFSFVESSTEKAMQFEELDPKVGAGTYCVFTDAKLVGKTSLPPGEYLHLTVGIKAWPGVIAIFRCFSNDTKSEHYQAILRMLRESIHEKLAPLR